MLIIHLTESQRDSIVKALHGDEDFKAIDYFDALTVLQEALPVESYTEGRTVR